MRRINIFHITLGLLFMMLTLIVVNTLGYMQGWCKDAMIREVSLGALGVVMLALLSVFIISWARLLRVRMRGGEIRREKYGVYIDTLLVLSIMWLLFVFMIAGPVC